jgi:hypothetical protein
MYGRYMILSEKHKNAFKDECNSLSLMVAGSLQKLAENPKDKQRLMEMVQSADTMIGSSRFLQNKDLEQIAKLTMEAFHGLDDATGKLDDIEIFSKIYFQILQTYKTCPNGYDVENDSCKLASMPTVIHCENVLALNSGIRFVGICSLQGKLLAQRFRYDITPLLSSDEINMEALQNVLKCVMQTKITDKKGKTFYSLTVSENIKNAIVAKDNDLYLLVSMDNNSDEFSIMKQILEYRIL